MAKIVRSISPGSQDLDLLEIGFSMWAMFKRPIKCLLFWMVQKSQEATWGMVLQPCKEWDKLTTFTSTHGWESQETPTMPPLPRKWLLTSIVPELGLFWGPYFLAEHVAFPLDSHDVMATSKPLQKLRVNSPTDMLMLDALEWLPWIQSPIFCGSWGTFIIKFTWHDGMSFLKMPCKEPSFGNHHSTPNLPKVSASAWIKYPSSASLPASSGLRAPTGQKTGDEGLDVVAIVVKRRRRRTEITHFC